MKLLHAKRSDPYCSHKHSWASVHVDNDWLVIYPFTFSDQHHWVYLRHRMLLPEIFGLCNDQLIAATLALNGSGCDSRLCLFTTSVCQHLYNEVWPCQAFSDKSAQNKCSDIMTWWRVHNVPPLHALNCRQHNDPERSWAKVLLQSISGPFNLPEREQRSGEGALIALPPHCVALHCYLDIYETPNVFT